jgi:6-phosphofructokinase 1
MTLPKTIDNDVAMTDITFGFDTALQIAANAIDRLHTTATSHHRIIVCEVMGHRAGWLALGAGIAGGADVILIPEIPYDPEVVAEHIIDRRRAGSRFSIVAVAEGIHSKAEAKAAGKAPAKGKKKSRTTGKGGRSASGTSTARRRTSEDDSVPEPVASRVARELQRLTGIDARVTSLGHVQRGGTPTATDRLLCTRLGTAAARLLDAGTYNVMVASRGGACEPVPLAEVAGRTKLIPLDHHWIDAALMVDTCLGDRL